MSIGAFASGKCGVKQSEMAHGLAILWDAGLCRRTHLDVSWLGASHPHSPSPTIMMHTGHCLSYGGVFVVAWAHHWGVCGTIVAHAHNMLTCNCQLVVTPCGHTNHSECTANWILRGIRWQKRDRSHLGNDLRSQVGTIAFPRWERPPFPGGNNRVS